VHSTTANTTNSAARVLGKQQHQDMSPISWQRPHQGRVKCNVDVSFSNALNIT